MSTETRISRRSFLRRSAAAAVALAGSGAAIPTVRSAFAQVGDYELVCIANGVRVRQDPGLTGAILGSINAGTVVNVIGETVFADGYGWVPIAVQGQRLSGYAASDFFERGGGGSGWFRGTPVHVTASGVNLRSGAGLDHPVIGTFWAGENAVVNDGPRSADGYTWYHITIAGMTGWMAGEFLTEGSSGVNPEPGPPSEEFPIGANVRPTNALNLRSGPGVGNGVIRVVAPEEIATIIDGPQHGGGYAWYQVEMWDGPGTVGWFAGEYLELARFEPTGARHRIFDGPLNLREWGGLDAPVIRGLPTGTIVVIADASFGMADGYTWMSVYLESEPSVRGWIAQGFSEEI